jgi:predicted dinucleotide-binding enzyme
MKFGILGTGMVGEAIATKLAALGHEVMMGARSAANEKAATWAAASGAKHGAFADAAAFGDVLFNCTKGEVSIEALEQAGADNLRGKVLVDLANPLDFSKGFPPTLFASNDDSLGERIQRAFPETRVVKSLNTVNCHLMVDAARVGGGDHTMFVCGEDAEAKGIVTGLLREQFGWKDVVDLGGIAQSRGTEAWLLLWTRLYGALKTPDFNLKIVR